MIQLAKTIEYIDDVHLGSNSLKDQSVWNELPLAGQWSKFSNDFNTPSCCKKGNIIYLKGLLKRSSTMIGDEIVAVLPVGYRPAHRVLVGALVDSNTIQRIDIHSNGQIKTSNVVANSAMLSLENICFSIN